MDSEEEGELLAQRLISAAAKHDEAAVRNLLKSTSATVKEAESGFTPLHAAIAACKERKESENEACTIVTLLLDEGAIWNDLDNNNKTPGCIANELGLRQVYQLMVNAGVRAELLFNRMSELDGSDEDLADEVEDDHETVDAFDQADGTETLHTTSAVADALSNGTDGQDTKEVQEDYIDHWDSNTEFLRSSLLFTDTQLLDSSSNAVMMDWETEIMSKHAKNLLPRSGLRAMNIGHGMGIVDTAIQTFEPKEHHIVEAHPAVLQQMRKNGWYDKPGVIIHEGRWQDILPKLIEQGQELDAIYYDTFAESYQDLKDLFSEHVIGLLERSGRFGFYNGLGADRQVVELDLQHAGLETQWEEIPVPTIDWNGIRRPYWNVDVYRLPTCNFIGG